MPRHLPQHPPLHLTLLRASAVGLCLFALSACDTPPTQVDRYFGLAVQQAQMQQTLNPMHSGCPMGPSPSSCSGAGHGSGHHGAGGSHRTSQDSDGETVHSAILRYQESFASPMTTGPGTSLGTGSAIKR